MAVFTDQLGRDIEISSTKRVISLVPSITELLLDLGVNVVGRTKFCIYPEDKIQEIAIVGGTKKFRFETIDKLEPDLIIANKEENYKDGIEKLASRYPVWISNVKTVEDSLDLVSQVGKLCGKISKSKHIVDSLRSQLDKIENQKSGTVLYLIWKKPWMVAGAGTYIDSMLSHVGYRNVIQDARYPEIQIDKFKDVDFIFLSSEPFPFKAKDLIEVSEIAKGPKVRLVNGEFYSWYGTRLLKVS